MSTKNLTLNSFLYHQTTDLSKSNNVDTNVRLIKRRHFTGKEDNFTCDFYASNIDL